MHEIKDEVNFNGEIHVVKLKGRKDLPEIINKDTGQRPSNQKGLLRSILHDIGYDVPTHSRFTTHRAVLLLYKLINNMELTNCKCQCQTRSLFWCETRSVLIT